MDLLAHLSTVLCQISDTLLALLVMELIRRIIQTLKQPSWSILQFMRNVNNIKIPAIVIVSVWIAIKSLENMWLPMDNPTFNTTRATYMTMGVVYQVIFGCSFVAMTPSIKLAIESKQKTNVGHILAQTFFSMLRKSIGCPLAKKAIDAYIHDERLSGTSFLSFGAFIFIPDLSADYYWPLVEAPNHDLALMFGLQNFSKSCHDIDPLDLPNPITYNFENNGTSRACERNVLSYQDFSTNQVQYLMYFDNRPLKAIQDRIRDRMSQKRVASPNGKLSENQIKKLRDEAKQDVKNYTRSLRKFLESEPNLKNQYHVIRFSEDIRVAVKFVLDSWPKFETQPSFLNVPKKKIDFFTE